VIKKLPLWSKMAPAIWTYLRFISKHDLNTSWTGDAYPFKLNKKLRFWSRKVGNKIQNSGGFLAFFCHLFDL
jgi:hypothetical protein